MAKPAGAVAAGGSPKGFWRYAPWLARVTLVVPTLLFIRIGWVYVSMPLQVAASSGMVLGSPEAITDTRAEGAIFLAVAALTLFSLFSTRRLLSGLVLAAIIIGFATAARLLGVLVDGAAPETVLKLKAEIVLLAVSAVGILIELGRRRRLGSAPPRDNLDVARVSGRQESYATGR